MSEGTVIGTVPKRPISCNYMFVGVCVCVSVYVLVYMSVYIFMCLSVCLYALIYNLSSYESTTVIVLLIFILHVPMYSIL